MEELPVAGEGSREKNELMNSGNCKKGISFSKISNQNLEIVLQSRNVHTTVRKYIQNPL